jgi:hypothetical protein
MKTKILASVIAALLSTTALADTSSMNGTVTGMGILENDYVRAGVNGTAGTFGSGGNTSPGLLFDSTGTGTFNTGYDYLTPGSPFDGFSVKITDTDGGTASNYHNNNANVKQIGGTANLTDGDNTLSWTGDWTHNSTTWSITNTYTLGATSPYIDITSSITAGSAAHSLSFGRFIDPDARAAAGDSSATDNVLGYGVIPDSNVAFSEATVSRYALGLYSTDSNVDAGITGWSNEADAYTENALDPTSNTNTGDNTIGLSWNFGSVSAGDILTANYAYIFGPSAFAAAEDAITGGAGGGADVTSWGTLTDVGSATDAASGGGTPTLVSTSTETITSTSEAVSSTLPVLTASITHHESSVAAGVQTIDRETTTSVTTPVEVTTTSFDRTTETYSDSSTVVTDGTATSTVAVRNDVVTTVTDPGSFVGRIDQVATAQDVASATVRNLDFSGIQGIRMNSTYDNGMSGSTTGFVVGGHKTNDNGVELTGGGARLSTTMNGNGDTVKADTDVVAASIANNGVELGFRHAMTDYEYTRTIGDFSNAGETKGTDTSVRLTYSIDTGKVQPVVGYTRGKKSVDAYEEAGSIQSARTVAGTNEMYGYGTIGLRGDLGLVDFVAMHHTDGTNDFSLGLEKDTGRVTWRVEGTRSMTDLGTTNAVSAGLLIRF